MRGVMSLERQHFYDFGNFRIDPEERILLRDGKPVPLTPKAFQLLNILVENHGHVVDKEKLMSEIWSDSFVEDGNLAFNARSLRKILDDDARNPNFIETIPRRGYRFIAEVRHVEEEDEQGGFKAETVVPLSNGNEAVSEKISRPFNRSESRRSGPVFVLADWRAQSVNVTQEVGEFVPEEGNGRIPRIELVPALPLIENSRKSYFYLLAGLISFIVLAGVGYGLFRFAFTKNAGTFSMTKVTRLTSNGKTKFAAVSPDGKFAAYIVDGGDRQSIRLKNIATGSDVEVLPPESTTIGSLTFSPDGDYLYYCAYHKLYQLPVLGGTPKKVLEPYGGLNHNRISFSPDGKQFTFVRNTWGGKATGPLPSLLPMRTAELSECSLPACIWALLCTRRHGRPMDERSHTRR